MARSLGFIAISLTLALSGCDFLPQDGLCPPQGMTISVLDAASTAEMRVYRSNDSREQEPLSIVSDPEAIARVVSFLQSFDDDWRAPWAGVPAGDLQVTFWNGSDRLGAVSVDASFVEAQGCGYFFIHDITTDERDALLSAAGVEWSDEVNQ